MGRQDNTNNYNLNNDPTMVNSSIALLQERFRQLEKVKERREGKELLKLFSSSDTTSHNMTNSSSANLHFQSSSPSSPKLVIPTHHTHKPNLHDSLSLGLNMANKLQGDDQYGHSTAKTHPSNSSLWSDHAASTSSMARNFEYSDVDTSLHL